MFRRVGGVSAIVSAGRRARRRRLDLVRAVRGAAAVRVTAKSRPRLPPPVLPSAYASSDSLSAVVMGEALDHRSFSHLASRHRLRERAVKTR